VVVGSLATAGLQSVLGVFKEVSGSRAPSKLLDGVGF
jgi:hypothetical protein